MASPLLLLAIVVGAIATTTLPDTVSAQLPRTLSYQGYLVDDKGQPVADGIHQIVFRMYDRVDAAGPIYEELRLVEVRRGLFSTTIGPFPDAVSFESPLWISVIPERQPESDRTMLFASPYALHAETASDLSPDSDILARLTRLESENRRLAALLESLLTTPD